MNAYRNVSYVGYVLMFFGLVLLGYGLSALSDQIALEEKGVIVRGVVTALNEKGIYRSPVVNFKTKEGERITFLSEYAINVELNPYQVGQEIDVVYNEDDPSLHKVYGNFEYNFLPLSLGVFGLFLLLFGWFVRRHFLQKVQAKP